MITNKKKPFKQGLVLAMCVLLSGCASTDSYNEAGINDPFESMNRATFAVNDAVDQALIRPVAKGYRAVVPKPARTGVRNVLRNLRSPVNMANQILQGDIRGAAADLTRAAINTTIGIGGLIDVADTAGLPYEYEDFGQTLAVWGVGHGPYLVLPILGPSSLRDATGLAVDAYADPLRIYLDNVDEEEWIYVRMGVSGLSKREALLDVLDDLRENSFDYYAALRSGYVQKRAALVNDDDPNAVSTSYSIPDYDDFE